MPEGKLTHLLSLCNFPLLDVLNLICCGLTAELRARPKTCGLGFKTMQESFHFITIASLSV